MKDSSEDSAILVVDDDADCREMLVDLLTNEGYMVASAKNGLQALVYLSGSPAAMIILDLKMPVMSGWEFRALQKSDPRLGSLPVVVMTASAHVRDIDADAVVRKPIDFGVLLGLVKQNCPPP